MYLDTIFQQTPFHIGTKKQSQAKRQRVYNLSLDLAQTAQHVENRTVRTPNPPLTQPHTNPPSTRRRTADWAEDGDEDDPNSLPPPSVTKNPDGTETHISYRLHETSGKKLKTTRTIKRTLVTHRVNPRVAERRSWAKFGASAKDAAGPQSDTTSVGEDIQLHPRVGYKSGDGKDDAAGGAGAAQAAGGLSEAEKKKLEARNMTVKCRICNGDHFTARCPFKDTMAPAGEGSTADAAAGDPLADPKGGAEGAIKGKYIAPGKRGEGSGERMAGKYERDDLATLRVTNVSVIPFCLPQLNIH